MKKKNWNIDIINNYHLGLEFSLNVTGSLQLDVGNDERKGVTEDKEGVVDNSVRNDSVFDLERQVGV
jgi:hypothetical protein